MAVLHGISGSVASWGGTFVANLLTKVGFMSFDLKMDAPAGDVTAFTSTIKSKIASVKAWSGTMRGHFNPALAGTTGGVTFASGYTSGARSWAFNVKNNPGDTTPFSPSGGWRTFVPGMNESSGEYETQVDDTALINANASYLGGASASATFSVDGTITFAQSIIVTGQNPIVDISDVDRNRVSWEGTGSITSAGANNPTGVGASSITTPVAGSLVLNANGSRTYTGSAFWSGIRITTPFDGPVTIEVDFQGSGALTFA